MNARGGMTLHVTDAAGLAEARRLHAEGLAGLDDGDLAVDLGAAVALGGALQQVLVALQREAAARGRAFHLRRLSDKARASLVWTGLVGWADDREHGKDGH